MHLGLVASLIVIRGQSIYVHVQGIFVPLILSLLEFVHGKSPPAKQHDEIHFFVLQMASDLSLYRID